MLLTGLTPLFVAPSFAAKQPAPAPTSAYDTYTKGVQLFQIAQQQQQQGNSAGQRALLREATQAFQQVLKTTPTCVEAHSNLGYIALTLGQYNPREFRNAELAFQKALALVPTHTESLNGLASAYIFLNQPDNALATQDKLLTLVPDNADYWFNRGSLLQKLQRWTEAQAAYEKALHFSPKHQRSLFNLGALAEREDHWDQAIAFYRKAKSVELSNPIGLEALNRIEALQALRQQGPGDTTTPAATISPTD